MNNKALMKIEKEIAQGIISLKKQFAVKTQLDFQELNEIINHVTYSYPEIFYMHEWEIIKFQDRVQIIPKYVYGVQEIKNKTKEIRHQSEIIISHINENSDYEKVKHLHDILIRNLIYIKTGDYRVHTIEGALLHKSAVCEGYSKLFKYVLDRLQIPCLIAYGQGDDGIGDVEAHAWNMVLIDGKWFHVDVTYDAGQSADKFVRYDYFLVDDASISVDHFYDKSKYPSALDNSYSLYDKPELIMWKKSTLKDYVQIRVKKGENRFVVKMPENIDRNNIIDKIVDTVFESLTEINFTGNINVMYNYARRIAFIDIS